MLFGYPPPSPQNNWLHYCVLAAVRKVHKLLDANQPYPKWPEILPVKHRATLRLRRTLRDRIRAYDTALRQLPTQAERDAVLAAVTDQNRIAELLSNEGNCAALTALPEAIRDAVASLFDYVFCILADLNVRDVHYKAIYDAVTDHICPFCGTEYFDAPGAPREALDHYLAKSHYPFAAANLRNLVPMGHKCNSSYKLADDVLHDADGVRRVAFNPYNHGNVGVVLDDSEPFNGSTPEKPNWRIEFNPDTPAVPTWDAVFSIRERYRRDHLDEGYMAWLAEFRSWARSAQQHGNTDADLVNALTLFEQFCASNGMRDRAFLKAAVFRMLRLRCEEGHDRLKQILRDLIAPPIAVAP